VKGNSFSGCALLQDRPVVNDAKETQGEPCMVGARGEGKRDKEGKELRDEPSKRGWDSGKGDGGGGGASRVGGVDGGSKGVRGWRTREAGESSREVKE